MFVIVLLFFLLACVHTQDDAGADLDLESMSVGGDREYIKGCQLKYVPTGRATAAYISERSRNSKKLKKYDPP